MRKKSVQKTGPDFSSDGPSVVSILSTEITNGMAIRGATIIQAWRENDPEVTSKISNASDLASLIFAEMLREQWVARRVSTSLKS